MFNDPITVAASAPNPELVFNLIRTDGYGAERRDPDGLYALTVNHSSNKQGDRHYIKIVKTVDAVNPYSGLTSPQSASVSISISKPPFGFDDDALAALYKALADTIADSEVTVAGLIAFQS